jgi:hypothetical protein
VPEAERSQKSGRIPALARERWQPDSGGQDGKTVPTVLTRECESKPSRTEARPGYRVRNRQDTWQHH